MPLCEKGRVRRGSFFNVLNVSVSCPLDGIKIKTRHPSSLYKNIGDRVAQRECGARRFIHFFICLINQYINILKIYFINVC